MSNRKKSKKLRAPREGEFLVYQAEDGKIKLDVRLEQETLWLTQQAIAELLQTTVPNISMHIKNIYDERELIPEATVKDFLIVQQEGQRTVTRAIAHYNLDMIISIGYRVKSIIATRFRIWATARLKEYIIKGFTMDDERLKNPPSKAAPVPVKNWMRSKNTIELLGLWEKLHNPKFKLVEFDRFKNEAGYNHFVLSPKKWIDATAAIGLQSQSGRYGGTYAHIDIALEFASWISVEFKFYLLKEFQRLKEQEALSLDWNIRRSLTKINYRIHTDAIKENIIPQMPG